MFFFPPKTLQLTIALFKPHLVKCPYAVKAVREAMLLSGFYFVRFKRHVLSPDEVKTFYEEHEGRFYYKRLITSVTSGPIECYLLARENAIEKWREMMGPTKTYMAQITAPSTLRGCYGLSDTRNAAHGADSPDSVEKELRVMFPDFNVKEWFKNEEIHFRNSYVSFDHHRLVHQVSESSPFLVNAS